MEKFYITISRQFGSLGRPIARELSEMLGVEYYDRDIVEQTSKKLNLSISKVSDKEEQTAKLGFLNMLFPLGEDSTDSQDKIFDVQRQIILDFAERGSAIFVGRCADYILRDYPNCLNVYIYASKEQRYLNCVNALQMEPAEATRMMAEVDKARERYWMKYAKYKQSDYKYRHIMIDSSILGVKGTARVLANIIKEKYGADIGSYEIS
jgi:cytidylate kinase